MGQFRMFDTLIESLMYCKDNWRKYGLNSLIVLVGYIIMMIVMFGSMRGVYSTSINASMESYLWVQAKMMILIIPMSLVFLVMMSVYIKITDDIYENRSTEINEQYSFTFKRTGRILLSSIVVMIPFLTIQGILLFFVSKTNSMFPINVVTILIGFGYWLFIMINPSIMIEDLSSMQAIKRSINMVLPNLLRILGFYISCFILYFLFAIIFALIFMLISIIPFLNVFVMIVLFVGSFVVGFLLMPFPMVFITLLFKSVTHRPYDRDERSTTESNDSYDDLFEDRVYE